MRVVVAGAGAMGSIFAAALIDAGQDVLLVDADAALVSHIRRAGLVIIDAEGAERHLAVDITGTPPTDVVADVVLFLVKGFRTGDAARLVAPLVGSGTTLVTLQNGIGNEDVLRQRFPGNDVVVGNSVHSATVAGLGIIHHTGVQPTYLGPDADTPMPAAEKVAASLAGSGFVTMVLGRAEIVFQRWSKLVMNCATLPVGALSGLDTTSLGQFEPLGELMDALVRESCQVALSEGIELDAEERIAYSRGLLENAGGRGSMSQDLLHGRKTEIDTINGAVVRIGRRRGVQVVLNEAMVSLVKGREAGIGRGVTP